MVCTTLCNILHVNIKHTSNITFNYRLHLKRDITDRGREMSKYSSHGARKIMHKISCKLNFAEYSGRIYNKLVFHSFQKVD